MIKGAIDLSRLPRDAPNLDQVAQGIGARAVDDRTLEIARRYEAKDARVRVVAHPNMGICNNLNDGTAITASEIAEGVNLCGVVSIAGLWLVGNDSRTAWKVDWQLPCPGAASRDRISDAYGCLRRRNGNREPERIGNSSRQRSRSSTGASKTGPERFRS